MNPTSLSFAKSADTVGKTITATATGVVTAQTSESWVTVEVNENIVTVKVTANSGKERKAYVIVLSDNKAATIEVTQAGV